MLAVTVPTGMEKAREEEVGAPCELGVVEAAQATLGAAMAFPASEAAELRRSALAGVAAPPEQSALMLARAPA